MDVSGIEMAAPAVVLVVMAAFIGGVVQSALGFGAAFVLVPMMAVLVPELLPGSVIIGIIPLTLVMVYRAGRTVDLRMVGRIMVGRVPGIAVGALVVAVSSARVMTAFVALLLLVAVVASAVGPELSVTPRREIVAGFVSGVTGTAAALAGPPLGLLYRSQSGQVLRSTLPWVWLVGLPLSVGALATAGELPWSHLWGGLGLGLPILAGMAVAEPIVRRLGDRFVRASVLVWAAVGASAALVRALIG